MNALSTGAIAALRQLAKTDHVSEMVFVGYASEPPIKSAEALELAKAGFAELAGKTLRLTAAGAQHVDRIDDWLHRDAPALARPILDDEGGGT